MENLCNHNINIVCSYRLEQAMTSNMLQNISLRNEIMICKEIISAVDIHRKAMELVLFDYCTHYTNGTNKKNKKYVILSPEVMNPRRVKLI